MIDKVILARKEQLVEIKGRCEEIALYVGVLMNEIQEELDALEVAARIYEKRGANENFIQFEELIIPQVKMLKAMVAPEQKLQIQNAKEKDELKQSTVLDKRGHADTETLKNEIHSIFKEMQDRVSTRELTSIVTTRHPELKSVWKKPFNNILLLVKKLEKDGSVVKVGKDGKSSAYILN